MTIAEPHAPSGAEDAPASVSVPEPHVTALPWREPQDVFLYFHREPYALFFDTSLAGGSIGRYSYITAKPAQILQTAPGQNVFAHIRDILKTKKTAHLPGLPPFQGGIAGYFGYGLATTADSAATVRRAGREEGKEADLPDYGLAVYDSVLAFDHAQKKLFIIAHGQNEKEARLRARNITDILAQPLPSAPQTCAVAGFRSAFTRDSYMQAVQKTIDYIHAGDIFQANLSQKFLAPLPPTFDPYGFYLGLRRESPAPFQAFFNFGDFQLASSSPERFLKVTPGGQVETRPIKGTRPRGKTQAQDTANAQNLLASEKDRAENAMIVDLLRNDLSRCCEDHSVRVEQFCALETYATVHHLVSTVTGQLRPDCAASHLLAACFPGGSVTGAPKIRAMEIIAELEMAARGPYCGAMGWLGFDGAMDTNIAIRTAVFANGQASFSVGGGIVADSSPLAEYEETLAKAQGLLRAFGRDGKESRQQQKEERQA